MDQAACWWPELSELPTRLTECQTEKCRWPDSKVRYCHWFDSRRNIATIAGSGSRIGGNSS
jgi:hypothetical protein